MLKKQTIWLLTMLSLVIVLSVYYVQGDPTKNDASTTATTGKDDGKKTTETSAAGNVLTQLRLELDDKRSQQRSDLQSVVASSKVSVEEKSKAQDAMDHLTTISQKESVLETLIKSDGYKDALVRAEGNEVRVTVQADKLTQEQANKIIQLTRKQLGVVKVTVTSQK